MSKKETNEKAKSVFIKENDLVDLIDNIITEAVAEKKKEWIAESTKKEAHKNALLESRIAKLEKLISNAKITKVVK